MNNFHHLLSQRKHAFTLLVALSPVPVGLSHSFNNVVFRLFKAVCRRFSADHGGEFIEVQCVDSR